MKKALTLLTLILLPLATSATLEEENRYKWATMEQILDSKIVRFCKAHKWAEETTYWAGWDRMLMWERCALILQAQYRFETKSCMDDAGSTSKYNNCFGFRWGIKKEWKEKYWASLNQNKDLVFPDKTNSIKFGVDRFYKVDRYKPISVIIRWGCYYSPAQQRTVCGRAFAQTSEVRYYNYIWFTKKYFRENRASLHGQD